MSDDPTNLGIDGRVDLSAVDRLALNHHGLQHAVEHGHHAFEGHSVKSDKPVDEDGYARSKAFRALWRGALLLAGFSVLVFLVGSGVGAGLGSLLGSGFLESGLGRLVTAGITALIAGGTWFGGKAYVEARQEAHEHNTKVSSELMHKVGRGMHIAQEVPILGTATPEISGIEAASEGHPSISGRIAQILEHGPRHRAGSFAESIAQERHAAAGAQKELV